MSKMPRTDDADHFEVVGAGELEIGCLSRTANAVGVAFGVSWSQHGYAGGVLDECEISRLIKVLQDRLVDIDRNREKLYGDRPWLESPEGINPHIALGLTIKE